jgi:hypothetical protein
MRVSRTPAGWLDRWGVMLTPRAPAAPYGHDYAANDLRLDEDSVCPRCLQWIGPDDIVRRTAFGPAQHEACPEPPSTATLSPLQQR